MELKEKLFETIEGQDVTMEIRTENTDNVISLTDVFIDAQESICSENDEYNINWDKAKILQDGNVFNVELPEMVYTFSLTTEI